jgi:hypothetical protein
VSRTTALAVAPDQRPAVLAEFQNAHGWSPSIWSRLIRHRGHGDNWWSSDYWRLNRLWAQIEELPEWQQDALVLTFDTGVIPCQAFKEAADNLDEFDRRLPAPDGHVNHVPAMAELLRTPIEAPLFGVWGTSVSENPFDPWDEENDQPGHGIPLYGGMYVLERHRHLLPPRVPEEDA